VADKIQKGGIEKLLLLLFTAIGFSPGGSSPYTITHNTSGHIIYIKVTIQNKVYTITKTSTP
jgi:hypothetical protein